MLYNILLLLTIYYISCIYGKTEFPCCVVHESEEACLAEKGSSCLYLGTDDPLYTPGASAGAVCVSVPWYDCEVNGKCPPPPPIPPPVDSECVLEKCDVISEAFNIAFVIDESGSVGYTNYLTSLDFIENMVKNDINNISAISLLAFGTNNDRIYAFNDSQSDQRQGALNALTAERNDYNYGWTCTNKALREAVREFNAADQRGELVDGKNILILMTDGYPNCGEDVCDEVGIISNIIDEFYIVGVSSGFNKAKVECLVNWQDDYSENDFIFDVPQFTSKFFYIIESRLRGIVCPIVFSLQEFESFSEKFEEIAGPLYQYGYDHGQIMFWLSIVLFIVAAFVYQRKKICSIKGKEVQPLMDGMRIETH